MRLNLIFLACCAFAQHSPAGQLLTALPMPESPTVCGLHDTFWRHVYDPARLLIQEPCVRVTGVIVDATAGKRRDGLRHESDGDTHGWLHLDGGQSKYLNAGNQSNEDGNLVFEVVCRFPVTQADAVSACKGYVSPVKIPPVGTHVVMTGTWVIDNKHARWMELHPVFAIEAVK